MIRLWVWCLQRAAFVAQSAGGIQFATLLGQAKLRLVRRLHAAGSSAR